MTQSVNGSAKMVAFTTAALLSMRRRNLPLQESEDELQTVYWTSQRTHCHRHPRQICSRDKDLGTLCGAVLRIEASGPTANVILSFLMLLRCF